AVALRHGAMHVDLTAHPANAGKGVWSADSWKLTSRGVSVAAAAVVDRLAYAAVARRCAAG
nr:hypothetical protein [Micromonospora sp. DSM 115978]